MEFISSNQQLTNHFVGIEMLRGLLVALHADQSCKYVRSHAKYPYVLCVLHGKKWYFINGLDANTYNISCHVYIYI